MLKEIKNREYYGRMLWGLEFAKSCGIKIDDSTEKEMMEAYDNGAKCSDCLIGNVAATLQTIAENYKLCIISNGYAGFLHATLEHYNLRQYFTSVIVSHDVNIEKPDRGIYDLALADCGIKPPEALMVGDGYLPDIWGAKIHGLLTCWINPNNVPPSIAANSSLSTPANLKRYPKPNGNEHDFVIKEISERPGALRKHNL
jgi:HAD superfamily hydrolase (TIGR01549 family)